MRARQDVPASLLRLADLQAGLVTREQALGHDLSRHVLARLVDNGTWRRIAPGLFTVAPVAPSWTALAWGGTLLGGPHARLGPQASGYLYGLSSKAPLPIDVLVPLATPTRVHGPWQFVRETPGVRPRRSPGSPPRLTAECTVLDLLGCRGEGDVVGLVTAAVQKGLTTPERLGELLGTRPRQRHRRLIVALLSEVADGVQSYLEVRYLRDVERAHGLPRGDRQTTSADLPYQRDVKYKRFGLIVELDGRIGHLGEGRFRDMNRDNRHVLRDEATLRYGYFDVTTRACPVAYQVYSALSRRGYLEPFGRCPHCAGVPEAHLEAG